jgi:hypothetical protein
MPSAFAILCLCGFALSSQAISSKYVLTKSVLIQLRVAVSEYEASYGEFPFAGDGSEDIVLLPRQYDELILLLAGGNPRKLRFLAEDDFVDYWGNRFQILLDTDGNGQVRINDDIVSERILVYSFGQNGTDEKGAGDDIASWRDRDRKGWAGWLILIAIVLGCISLRFVLKRVDVRLREWTRKLYER